MDQLINNDPIDTINYIRNLKATENIDYIRIKFNKLISMSQRMAINNAFRNNDDVSLEFFSQEKEIAQQAKEKLIKDTEEVKFLLDPSLTDEQRFVMWVNYLKKDETYLTVEQLEEILRSE